MIKNDLGKKLLFFDGGMGTLRTILNMHYTFFCKGYLQEPAQKQEQELSQCQA